MIRLIEKEDINDVLNLLKQVNYVHYIKRPDIFKPNTKYDYDELLNLIGDKLNPIFVYVENNRVLGYAMTNTIKHENSRLLTDIKTLYIDDICVDENERGKGIATKIYRHVEQYAKENNYYNITLNVWEINPEARAFYDKMDLKPLKTTMEEIL
jgi:ribosomal protein S18 acetylase RimI-like enzyme